MRARWPAARRLRKRASALEVPQWVWSLDFAHAVARVRAAATTLQRGSATFEAATRSACGRGRRRRSLVQAGCTRPAGRARRCA